MREPPNALTTLLDTIHAYKYEYTQHITHSVYGEHLDDDSGAVCVCVCVSVIGVVSCCIIFPHFDSLQCHPIPTNGKHKEKKRETKHSYVVAEHGGSLVAGNTFWISPLAIIKITLADTFSLSLSPSP